MINPFMNWFGELFGKKLPLQEDTSKESLPESLSEPARYTITKYLDGSFTVKYEYKLGQYDRSTNIIPWKNSLTAEIEPLEYSGTSVSVNHRFNSLEEVKDIIEKHKADVAIAREEKRLRTTPDWSITVGVNDDA